MEIGFEQYATDGVVEKMQWKKCFEVDETSFDDSLPKSIGTNELAIYTDGLKQDDGSTGAGVVFHEMEGDQIFTDRWFLGRNILVYQAEVYVIKQALIALLNLGLNGNTVYNHTNSRAAFIALKSQKVDSQQIAVLISHLNVGSLSNKIILRWVKAHAGHVGNEQADQLAKAGAASTDLAVPEDLPGISNAVICSKLREQICEYWNNWWVNSNPCRQTKHFFPALDNSFSVRLNKCSRLQFSDLVQFITGHIFMAYHKSLVEYGFAEEEASLCTYCEGGALALPTMYGLNVLLLSVLGWLA